MSDTKRQAFSRPIEAFSVGRLPRITFGPGGIDRVAGIVAGYGRRALIVTGTGSLRAGGRHERLRAALTGERVEHQEIVVEGEPTPELVDDAVRAFHDAGIDVVLGVGGGSVLDSAKAIAGLLRVGTSIRNHLEGVGPQVPYAGPPTPFIAVPTTAGTGSEATRNAVVSVPGQFKKSFRDERLVAAEAIVDPDLLATCPPPLIARNGMDAVTQLIESYASIRAGPFTDALALSGLRAAGEGLLAWHDAVVAGTPDSPVAATGRSAMAYAALLSGITLAHAGLGASHGLASPLGAFFPIPHGTACGATLMATIEANIAALAKRDPGGEGLRRYAELGRAIGPDGLDDREARTSLVDTLRDWTTRLAIPGLATFGMTDADVGRVVAASRGGSMRTNPIELTDVEIETIVRRSL